MINVIRLTPRMALLYRGAGPGSWWHVNDARINGFAPHSPGATPSKDRIVNHIARASIKSPYISFSRSFGIARAYALVGPAGFASAASPGYVYEIEVLDDKMCTPIDPVVEISKELPSPWESPHYHHDGSPTFLLGVVDPINGLAHLQQQCVFPPGSLGTPRAPNLSQEMEVFVRALRDAEVLIRGNIPSSIVHNRYDVY
jgi:hypothetical protein